MPLSAAGVFARLSAGETFGGDDSTATECPTFPGMAGGADGW